MRITDDKSRWTPVLRGAIYCSPACGGGCKKADFDFATAEAEALARRLGPGWVADVWENVGWHFRVKCGLAEVHPPGRGGTPYIVYLKLNPPFITRDPDPLVALYRATTEAKAHLGEQARLREAVVLGTSWAALASEEVQL